MTLDGNQLLRQMFEALPADQRVAFVEEVIASLPAQLKMELRNRILDSSASLAATTPDLVDIEVSPEDLDALPDEWKPEIESFPGSGDSKNGQPESRIEILEREIEKFSTISKTAFTQDKNRLKREMVGCIAIFGLVCVLIVFLAILGREAWEYLFSLF